ncbi:hypothetical protein [Nocardioides halotolerans]|uniref:hypothetical protein n=1 Tax=Nocardioides halotolerans TaxID=433660 RepID=UPI00041597AF|nr:hypothetical protein [Nocardioides halotolerans]
MPAPSVRGRAWPVAPLAVLLVALALPGTPAPASAVAVAPASAPSSAPPSAKAEAAKRSGIQVRRGGRDAEVRFRTTKPGEAFLGLRVSARKVAWGKPKHEAAVLSVFVDDHYATDLVVHSDRPTRRELALGSLAAGVHTLRLHYAADRSSRRAGAVRVRHLRVHTVSRKSPEYAAARYAPVLYGRNVSGLGGKFQSAKTDSPLVAWHEITPGAKPGHSVIEYSVVWSNEDGGTDTAGLMARWGRTTDIEWVYRVEVNRAGHLVRGSGVYQASGHRTLRFKGRYDGTHPLLQTCTSNNNVCDTVDDPIRFALSTRETRSAEQPREHVMDAHPWTYSVMAQEMLREGRIETPSDPSTPAVGDQRSYLYVAFDHDTSPAGSEAGVGLAVDVRLVGDPATYSSDHQIPELSVNRDVPAATTVELPVGTTPADVASVSVRRVPLGLTDNGATLTVTDLDRAFFLGSNYLPQASFVSWHGSQVLTAVAPTAVLWSAGG